MKYLSSLFFLFIISLNSYAFVGNWSSTKLQTYEAKEGTYKTKAFIRWLPGYGKNFQVGDVNYLVFPTQKDTLENSEKLFDDQIRTVEKELNVKNWKKRIVKDLRIYETWDKETVRHYRIAMRKTEKSFEVSTASYRGIYKNPLELETSLIQMSLFGHLGETTANKLVQLFNKLIKAEFIISSANAQTVGDIFGGDTGDGTDWPFTDEELLEALQSLTQAMTEVKPELVKLNETLPELISTIEHTNQIFEANWPETNLQLSRLNTNIETITPYIPEMIAMGNNMSSSINNASNSINRISDQIDQYMPDLLQIGNDLNTNLSSISAQIPDIVDMGNNFTNTVQGISDQIPDIVGVANRGVDEFARLNDNLEVGISVIDEQATRFNDSIEKISGQVDRALDKVDELAPQFLDRWDKTLGTMDNLETMIDARWGETLDVANRAVDQYTRTNDLIEKFMDPGQLAKMGLTLGLTLGGGMALMSTVTTWLMNGLAKGVKILWKKIKKSKKDKISDGEDFLKMVDAYESVQKQVENMEKALDNLYDYAKNIPASDRNSNLASLINKLKNNRNQIDLMLKKVQFKYVEQDNENCIYCQENSHLPIQSEYSLLKMNLDSIDSILATFKNVDENKTFCDSLKNFIEKLIASESYLQHIREDLLVMESQWFDYLDLKFKDRVDNYKDIIKNDGKNERLRKLKSEYNRSVGLINKHTEKLKSSCYSKNNKKIRKSANECEDFIKDYYLNEHLPVMKNLCADNAISKLNYLSESEIKKKVKCEASDVVKLTSDWPQRCYEQYFEDYENKETVRKACYQAYKVLSLLNEKQRRACSVQNLLVESERNYKCYKYAVSETKKSYATGQTNCKNKKTRKDYTKILCSQVTEANMNRQVEYLEKEYNESQKFWNAYYDDKSNLQKQMLFEPISTWKYKENWGRFFQEMRCKNKNQSLSQRYLKEEDHDPCKDKSSIVDFEDLTDEEVISSVDEILDLEGDNDEDFPNTAIVNGKLKELVRKKRSIDNLCHE